MSKPDNACVICLLVLHVAEEGVLVQGSRDASVSVSRTHFHNQETKRAGFRSGASCLKSSSRRFCCTSSWETQTFPQHPCPEKEAVWLPLTRPVIAHTGRFQKEINRIERRPSAAQHLHASSSLQVLFHRFKPHF